MAQVYNLPITRAFTNLGKVGVGFQLFFFEVDTTTKKAVFAEAALTTPLTNPVITDANGYFPQIFMEGTGNDYKAVLSDDTDTDPPTSPIFTANPIEVDANDINAFGTRPAQHWGTTTNIATAYQISPVTALAAYTDDLLFSLEIHLDNTGTATLAVEDLNDLGGFLTALNIKKYDGAGGKVDIEVGDLQANQTYLFRIDMIDAVVLNPQKPFLNSANFVNNNFNPNLIINGQGLIAQRGVTFDSTTTPANSDDTYLLDRMLLLSDGNNVADVSQETTTVPIGSFSAIKFDQETANKQWGYLQILEAKDAAAIIGGTASLSFKARKGGSNATLETLRAAVLSWDSTADTVTSDVVGTWNGAGTDPSLAANWTYENAPSNLTLTTSYQTFKVDDVSIDTSSTNNVAIFIWLDDTDATVADTAFITDIKLEVGVVATDFIARPIEQEIALSFRFYQKSYNLDVNPGTVTDIGFEGCFSQSSSLLFQQTYALKQTMRISPTITVHNPSTGAAGQIRDEATGSARGQNLVAISQRNYRMQSSSMNIGNIHTWQWAADGEL